MRRGWEGGLLQPNYLELVWREAETRRMRASVWVQLGAGVKDTGVLVPRGKTGRWGGGGTAGRKAT